LFSVPVDRNKRPGDPPETGGEYLGPRVVVVVFVKQSEFSFNTNYKVLNQVINSHLHGYQTNKERLFVVGSFLNAAPGDWIANLSTNAPPFKNSTLEIIHFQVGDGEGGGGAAG